MGSCKDRLAVVLPFVFVLAMSSSVRSEGKGSDLIDPLQPFVKAIAGDIGTLPESRRPLLDQVADYVTQKLLDGKPVRLNFICTHNSRRSHMGQVWCQIAANYYGVAMVETYSGGTEATACNIRTIEALRRAGLSIATTTTGANPIYSLEYSDSQPPIRAFSKKYSNDANPKEGFAAMMCCSDADTRCPVVFGSDARFALHYEDPKVADGTSEESNRYDERSRQIATEMFYVMSAVSQQLAKGS